MKITHWLSLLCAILGTATLPAATIVFSYDGTDGATSHTIASGQFSFANANATTLAFSDLTSFTLHQTVNIANGDAIGYFDFTKADLLSFSLSLNQGTVTNAAFQTQKKQETSSPTGTDFHAQNFIALTATTAKTQYGDGFTADDTTGPLTFSPAPEPTTALLFLSGFLGMHLRRLRKRF